MLSLLHCLPSVQCVGLTIIDTNGILTSLPAKCAMCQSNKNISNGILTSLPAMCEMCQTNKNISNGILTSLPAMCAMCQTNKIDKRVSLLETEAAYKRPN